METDYNCDMKLLHRICTLLFMMGEFTSFSQNSVRESAHWTKLFVSEMTNLNASDWPSLKLKTQRKRVRLVTFLSCLVFLWAHGFGHVCLLWAFLSCLVCLCEHMAFVCFCVPYALLSVFGFDPAARPLVTWLLVDLPHLLSLVSLLISFPIYSPIFLWPLLVCCGLFVTLLSTCTGLDIK